MQVHHRIDGAQGKGIATGKLCSILLFALALGLSHTAAQASAFQLAEQNASGLGNGYAGSAAIAENASTIYYNPAGMTRLPGVNISLGAVAVTPSFRFSDDGSVGPGGLPLGSDPGGNAGSTAIVPNAYLSAQLSPQWFAGVGVSVPFGLSTDYDDDWIGRYHSTHFGLKTINVNPSIAYKVDQTLSIGAGVNWQYLDADYRRHLPAAGLAAQLPAGLPAPIRTALTNQLAASPDMKAKAKLSGDAWGWNVGVLYQLTSQTRIGASYRSRMRYHLSGSTSLSQVPGLFASQIPSSVDNSSTVTLPDTAILSLVHDINSKWQLLADVSWTGWSSLPSLKIDNGALGEDKLTLDFRDTWRVALGANYQLNGRWKLRGGVAYDQSPIPDSSVRLTSLPDSDRIILSIGAQYRLNKHATMDVGYSHLFLNHPGIDNDTDPKKGTVTGNYSVDADLLGVQVSYQF